ncbi:hypothetical protein PR048_006283 [Dryococelus australis]|uniref:Uncharacterized protein n=1 Tax=Dryococelus australis TaxID=614101 RepID=A0ABQ9IAK8_9NEOP|nr:hypothetical protein PR048_006283 [Dryococelus australis]
MAPKFYCSFLRMEAYARAFSRPAAQSIGGLPHRAEANKTQGSLPGPLAANQRIGTPSGPHLLCDTTMGILKTSNEYLFGFSADVFPSDGNTARLARRSDEALGVRVSVARIAPSLLDLERATHASTLPPLFIFGVDVLSCNCAPSVPGVRRNCTYCTDLQQAVTYVVTLVLTSLLRDEFSARCSRKRNIENIASGLKLSETAAVAGTALRDFTKTWNNQVEAVPISTLASHQGEPGSIPGRVTGLSPIPSFRRRSIFTSITLIGSQDRSKSLHSPALLGACHSDPRLDQRLRLPRPTIVIPVSKGFFMFFSVVVSPWCSRFFPSLHSAAAPSQSHTLLADWGRRTCSFTLNLNHRMGRKAVQCWDTEIGCAQPAESVYLIFSLWIYTLHPSHQAIPARDKPTPTAAVTVWKLTRGCVFHYATAYLIRVVAAVPMSLMHFLRASFPQLLGHLYLGWHTPSTLDLPLLVVLGPRWQSGWAARLQPRRTGFNSRPDHSGIFASVNRAGRSRWSTAFSRISRFPRPFIPALLHSHLISPSSALKTSGNSLDLHSGGSGFHSRSGHPDFGFRLFPEITPGECWDGMGP